MSDETKPPPSNVVRPDGWRKEWRAPKPKRRKATRARACARAVSRVTAEQRPEELRQRALDRLTTELDEAAESKDRIAAARLILDWADGRSGADNGDDLTPEEWAEVAEYAAGMAGKESAG